MSKQPTSFTHVIRHWKTTTDMAKALDVPRANVAMWLARDSIPVWVWRKVIERGPDVGLHVDESALIDLAETRHAERFSSVPTFASAEAKANELRQKRRELDADARQSAPGGGGGTGPA